MRFRHGMVLIVAVLVAAGAVVPVVAVADGSQSGGDAGDSAATQADIDSLTQSHATSGGRAGLSPPGTDRASARPPVLTTSREGSSGGSVQGDLAQRDEAISTARAQTRSAATAATASDGNLHQLTRLSLTPTQPGEIAATTRYEVPSSVQSLEVRVPAAATVKQTDGFDKQDDRTYAWDQHTATPRLVYDFSVNRTFGGARSPPERGAVDQRAQTGSYSYVDVGSWAITPVPSMGVSWRYTSSQDVQLQKNVTIDGEGATGGEIAYLGPYDEHVRTATDQRLRLVVPRAATLRESPTDILDSLSSASERLAVGGRDPEVFFVAAPTSVDWGPLGLESGRSDAWIRADSRLDTATNVWLHEYVHTRQEYDPTDATRWTLEGAADYYAVLLTYEQGRISFTTVRDRLRRGASGAAASAILAEPSTWSRAANYLKGALVWGVIDLRIRRSGEQSADDVLARLNAHDDRVTATAFLNAVSAAGDSDVEQTARRYTETQAAPETWSLEEHSDAFGGANVRVLLDSASYQISGPYRQRPIEPDQPLVREETLTASVPVTNQGDQRAVSEVQIQRDGTTIARERVELDPGEERTITLQAALRETGTYRLVTGSGSVTFEVSDPASATVRELSVSPTAVAVGESATVSIVVGNDADRPAAATIELTADGESVGSEPVQLDADAETTLSLSVDFAEPGVRTLRAGEETVTVDVRERTATATPTPIATTADGSLPVSLVGLAMVLAMVLIGRRRV